jgi:hypothetical protein
MNLLYGFVGPGYLSHYILVCPMLLQSKCRLKCWNPKVMYKLMVKSCELIELGNPPSLCCNPLTRVATPDPASCVETWCGYWYLVLSRSCKSTRNDSSRYAKEQPRTSTGSLFEIKNQNDPCPLLSVSISGFQPQNFSKSNWTNQISP